MRRASNRPCRSSLTQYAARFRSSFIRIWPILVVPALDRDIPKPAGHAPRVTWEQHFTRANPAHDGHLTLTEAKEGYPLVAEHFDDIDTDHKGYVTENDIRAWQIMRRAARRLTQPLPPRRRRSRSGGTIRSIRGAWDPHWFRQGQCRVSEVGYSLAVSSPASGA